MMYALSAIARLVRSLSSFVLELTANAWIEVSRGFGFLRFPSIETSKKFLERNYPSIYLYGKESADSDNQAAKVRISFSRERNDLPRGDKEGEWTCKIVRPSANCLP